MTTTDLQMMDKMINAVIYIMCIPNWYIFILLQLHVNATSATPWSYKHLPGTWGMSGYDSSKFKTLVTSLTISTYFDFFHIDNATICSLFITFLLVKHWFAKGILSFSKLPVETYWAHPESKKHIFTPSVNLTPFIVLHQSAELVSQCFY